MTHVVLPVLVKTYFLQCVNSGSLLKDNFELMKLLFEVVRYYQSSSKSIPVSLRTTLRTPIKRINRDLPVPGTSQEDNVQVIDLLIVDI